MCEQNKIFFCQMPQHPFKTKSISFSKSAAVYNNMLSQSFNAPWCLRKYKLTSSTLFCNTNCPIISCVLRRVWESQSSLNVFTHFSPWHNPKVMWKYMHTPTHVAELLLKFHLTHQQTDSIFCSYAKTPYARLFHIFCCTTKYTHHWLSGMGWVKSCFSRNNIRRRSIYIKPTV